MNKINNLNNQNTLSNVNLSLFNTDNLISIKYKNNYPVINLNKNGNSEVISTLDSNNLNKSLNKLNEYQNNIKLQSNTAQIINSKEKVIVTKEFSLPALAVPAVTASQPGLAASPFPSAPSSMGAVGAWAGSGVVGNVEGLAQALPVHKKLSLGQINFINMLLPVKSNNIYTPTPNPKKHPFKNMDIKVTQILNKIITFKSEIAKSQYIQYHYNKPRGVKKLFMESIISIIINSFYEMKSIISTPVFYITPNKVVIHLLYYVKRNKIRVNRNNFLSMTKMNIKSHGSLKPAPSVRAKFLDIHKHKFELLCYILSKCFNKKVVLDLVRIHNPYNDSKILAETFGLLSQNVRVKIRKLVDKTFKFAKIKNISKMTNKRSIIPSFITGIKIKLGGRIPSLKSAPRYSVLKYQKGTLGRCKANFLTSSRSTYKCKRGSFSYTVSIGQSFF